MKPVLSVQYYMHSGFSCAKDGVLLVFDYWLGEREELPEAVRISPELLGRYREVYVFISHSHPDHFDPVVFTWRRAAPETTVSYILSYDMPTGTSGLYLRPGEERELGRHVRVKAFPSTDLGVSWLVELDGIRIFHAGDLNFWHWREESTLQEIDEAETEFYDACRPIEEEVRRGGVFDLAFFPVDSRQGPLYDAGANYFIMSAKPRLLIPMHFWEHTEIAAEFARRSSNRDTQVIAMTYPGMEIQLEFDEDGFMTIYMPSRPEPEPEEPPEEDEEEGDDPFAQTDMPVQLD